MFEKAVKAVETGNKVWKVCNKYVKLFSGDPWKSTYEKKTKFSKVKKILMFNGNLPVLLHWFLSYSAGNPRNGKFYIFT